jgi:hypothetical protein
VHVLEPSYFSNATSGDDDSDDTRRRLVAKGSSGTSGVYVDSEYYEVFWPRGGTDDWAGTNGAIWCHTTLRFLVFAFEIMLLASMLMRLYWRLCCFRRMVQVNADLLTKQGGEEKRKSTDFDPSAYGWPETTEFTTSVAANIARANDDKEGWLPTVTIPSFKTTLNSFKTSPAPRVARTAQPETEERRAPEPALKREVGPCSWMRCIYPPDPLVAHDA